MRRGVAGVLVAFAVTACLGDAAGETTTTTTMVPEPPTTLTPSTTSPAVITESSTTTQPDGPVDICLGRGEVWEAGRTYVADCFIVPVSFAPATDDWNSFGAEGRWVLLRWADPGSEATGSLGLLAYRQDEEARSVIEAAISARDSVSPLSEVREGEVAGRPALIVDVEAAGKDQIDSRCRDVWELFSPPPIGFQSCAFSRVWVVDAGDGRVTAIGTIRDPRSAGESGPDPQVFRRLIPEIERLLDSMTFGGSNG